MYLEAISLPSDVFASTSVSLCHLEALKVQLDPSFVHTFPWFPLNTVNIKVLTVGLGPGPSFPQHPLLRLCPCWALQDHLANPPRASPNSSGLNSKAPLGDIPGGPRPKTALCKSSQVPESDGPESPGVTPPSWSQDPRTLSPSLTQQMRSHGLSWILPLCSLSWLPCSLRLCTSWDLVSWEEVAPCSAPPGPSFWALDWRSLEMGHGVGWQTESRGRLQGVAELRLAGLELTDASLRLLLRHAPQLSALDLSHCAHVGDPSVHLLTAPTSPLRETLVHLNLAGCHRLTDHCLPLFRRCPRLRRLDLRSCRQLSPEACARLAAAGPPGPFRCPEEKLLLKDS
ncbi:hypothetical protein FD755_003889 [Muntiacus reevesi]|uniref:F-box domain-containing protein n=1 Tax=Muntiacus reevesi TaxID=9886 RepID=A0A5J5MR29_MUNRE|nr:hypothetical protein FD755_003889 [Muntiacus reevesi]